MSLLLVQPQDLIGLRVPSRTEGGAINSPNRQPGGFTKGGVPKAVLDLRNVGPIDYFVEHQLVDKDSEIVTRQIGDSIVKFEKRHGWLMVPIEVDGKPAGPDNSPYKSLKPRPTIYSENLFQQPNWEARREESGRCYFTFRSSEQGIGTITYELSNEEFEDVRAERLTFNDLVNLTDRNPQRHPV